MFAVHHCRLKKKREGRQFCFESGESKLSVSIQTLLGVRIGGEIV